MELPKRKNIRLKDFDYSQNGAYFVTLCIKNNQNLLWNVGATCGRPSTDKTHLNENGIIVDNEINKIKAIYNQSVNIDKYVIMPNHVHLIIVLCNEIDGRPQVAPTISRIIQQFKGAISKQIGFAIWQKLFHDHIIRNEEEYLKIWQYIDTNPQKWELDCYHIKRP